MKRDTDRRIKNPALITTAIASLIAIIGIVALTADGARQSGIAATTIASAENENLAGMANAAPCITCIEGLAEQDGGRVCAETCVSTCQSKCNVAGMKDACGRFPFCSGGSDAGRVKIKVNSFNGHEDAPMTTGVSKGSSALSTDASKSKCFKTTTCANDAECRDAYLPNAYCSKYARQCVCA